jgi:hypothetical protein
VVPSPRLVARSPPLGDHCLSKSDHDTFEMNPFLILYIKSLHLCGYVCDE